MWPSGVQTLIRRICPGRTSSVSRLLTPLAFEPVGSCMAAEMVSVPIDAATTDSAARTASLIAVWRR